MGCKCHSYSEVTPLVVTREWSVSRHLLNHGCNWDILRTYTHRSYFFRRLFRERSLACGKEHQQVFRRPSYDHNSSYGFQLDTCSLGLSFLLCERGDYIFPINSKTIWSLISPYARWSEANHNQSCIMISLSPEHFCLHGKLKTKLNVTLENIEMSIRNI